MLKTSSTFKYCKKFKQENLTNLPNITYKDTGHYEIDYYGCWHLCEVTESSDPEKPVGQQFRIIGDYP